LECLEGRELLTNTPLGFSLPDLTINGFTAPVASWGLPLSVTVDVHNIGASTIIEPLALTPGATSSADAAATQVSVFAFPVVPATTTTTVTGPRGHHHLVHVHHHHFVPGSTNGLLIGTFDIPAVRQNSDIQLTQTLTLPAQPTGFPGDGGAIQLVFQVNSKFNVFESDYTNDFSGPVNVAIEAPLPELAVVGFDVPPVMQPGDTIQPNIRIANLGPADTAPQGPVTIALIASTTPAFTKGSTVVAAYTVANIPAQSLVPSKVALFGDANLVPPKNIVTIAGAPVTLPVSPKRFFIGVVIDPNNQIKQLRTVPQSVKPANNFSLPHVVGPPIPFLPPAGVLVAGGVANVPIFPIPFQGNPVGGSPGGTPFPAVYPPPQLSVLVQAAGSNTPPGQITATSTATGSVTDASIPTSLFGSSRQTALQAIQGGFDTSTAFAGLNPAIGEQVAAQSRRVNLS
jgi:hypothetical protein